MAITPLPTPVPQTSDPVNFNTRADAFMTALPTFATEANALQVDVNAKQVAAATSAANALTSETNAASSSSSANAASLAAIAAAGASAWVSGTTYAVGDCRYSLVNFQTYRRKTAGAGTTDPSLDSTNWTIISNSGWVLLETIPVTSTSAINRPSIFSSQYDSYKIVITGVQPSASDILAIQLGVSGSIVSTGNYYQLNAINNPLSGGFSRVLLYPSNVDGSSGISLEVSIKNTNNGLFSMVNCEGVTSNGTACSLVVLGGAFTPPSGLPVTGVKVFWNTGANFVAQGKIRIYGLTN